MKSPEVLLAKSGAFSSSEIMFAQLDSILFGSKVGLSEGKFLIVVDDEDRENEGDFIIAAEKITPDKVNFMMHHGRGVLCAPISEERAHEYLLLWKDRLR